MGNAVIIVAGGAGTRMNSDRPKQFIELSGKPVLIRTMECFLEYDPGITMVVVLPRGFIEEGKTLTAKYMLSGDIIFTEGGATRFHSVANGLLNIRDARIVAVHDGARPLVSQETIRRCFQAAKEKGGAVPVADENESLRILDGDGSKPIDRNRIKKVQTPQVFLADRLIKAYSQEYDPVFTDDASVYETMYDEVVLITGNRENIKITYPEDLLFAELIIKSAER